MRGYTQDKDAYLKRLRRIEGQVRGLQRMVESDTYCIDILTQVSAVTRALQAVALGLVEDHLGHCVAQAIEEGGPEAQDKVKEASEAIARLVRSLPPTPGFSAFKLGLRPFWAILAQREFPPCETRPLAGESAASSRRRHPGNHLGAAQRSR